MFSNGCGRSRPRSVGLDGALTETETRIVARIARYYKSGQERAPARPWLALALHVNREGMLIKGYKLL